MCVLSEGKAASRKGGVMEGSVARKDKGLAKRIPDLKPGKYADGLPLRQVKYLECKLILKPNKFTSRKRLLDFAKLLRRPAEEHGIGFSMDAFADAPVQIREVLFVDTRDCRLYNNAFILRRRIPYKDGFPAGDPEVVFKFRHPDLQTTAETDVRPQIFGDYAIKFKCEMLPLKDQLGGIRLLFSHNVEFPLSQLHDDTRLSMETLRRVFPLLRRLDKDFQRAGRCRIKHNRRRGIARYRRPRFRRWIDCESKCGALARQGRPPSPHRRVRISAQIQAPGGPSGRDNQEGGSVFHIAAA